MSVSVRSFSRAGTPGLFSTGFLPSLFGFGGDMTSVGSVVVVDSFTVAGFASTASRLEYCS